MSKKKVAAGANLNGHIFISYSHLDSGLASDTATSLARSGIPFFIDRVGLSPGDSLRVRLGEALDGASAIVALLSARSVQSEWVRRELTLISDRGTRVIPVRCDDSDWPTSFALAIGDALYVDGRDPVALAGRIPKVFHDRFPRYPAEGTERFFRLATRPRAPYARFFPGTLQVAIQEVAFGRVAVVVPTDNSVNLSGKVTRSVLDYLGVDPSSLDRPSNPIPSRESFVLGEMAFQGRPLHLVASTVFNSSRRPEAEDQWRAAAAVLDRAQELGCATVLVPPMGTGVFRWPSGAALQHWFYGAIRWVACHPLATEEWVWPIICGPGAGGQRMFTDYLSRLDAGAMARLENRQLELSVRYAGETRPAGLVRFDMMLGSVVGQAWPELRGRRSLEAIHPVDATEHSGDRLTYDLGFPLNKTVFADGDEIQVIERS
jgi:TIR domain